MMAIFSNMVEKTIEVFMDDFTALGKSFDNCLENLRQALIRCEETNLIENATNKALYWGTGFQKEELR